MNPLLELRRLGRSMWLDNLSRAGLRGELARLIAHGRICTLTFNPGLFQKAIFERRGRPCDEACATLLKMMQ